MSVLEDIGLTKREIQVYEEVLRRGETKIGALFDDLHMHSQIIYRVIKSLMDKGLLTEFYRRGRKHVRAESPNKLIQMEEKRLAQLTAFVPSLISLHKKGQYETIVRVEKGNDAIIRLRTKAIEVLKRGQTFYVIGGSTEHFYDIMGRELERIERLRVKKGIKRKIISYESQRGRTQIIEKKTPLVDLRYIEGEKISPASTVVFGDTVGLMIWTDEPVAITLQSKELADSYRDFFESLWKIAKP
jgi:sugar-specific transcriptional regulator TrmB